MRTVFILINQRLEDVNVRAHLFITEYNRSVQGSLTGDVMRITDTSWSDIQALPSSAGKKIM